MVWSGHPGEGPCADLHARRLPHLALRKTLAPLTYTDEHPAQHGNPVAPARRSAHAAAKAAAHASANGQILHSFPRPAGSPRHPDPQHHHHRRQLRQDQRAHPRPVPRLRPHRRADPADPHPEVDKSSIGPGAKPAAQRRTGLPHVLKLRSSQKVPRRSEDETATAGQLPGNDPALDLVRPLANDHQRSIAEVTLHVEFE